MSDIYSIGNKNLVIIIVFTTYPRENRLKSKLSSYIMA